MDKILGGNPVSVAAGTGEDGSIVAEEGATPSPLTCEAITCVPDTGRLQPTMNINANRTGMTRATMLPENLAVDDIKSLLIGSIESLLQAENTNLQSVP